MKNTENEYVNTDISAEKCPDSVCCRKGGRRICTCIGRILFILGIIAFAFVSGVLGAVYSSKILSVVNLPFLSEEEKTMTRIVEERVVQEDSLITDLVERASPAVVSIVATKDVPTMRNMGSFGFPFFFFDPFWQQDRQENQENEGRTEKQKIGSGTGFFVSSDGLVVTNKHVVSDESAEYTVFLSGDKKYSAKVLARDPAHDLAVLKVEGEKFPTLELGDSSSVKVGQTVIAIGNSLGEFSNSVSRGIISGLGRNVIAGSGFGDEESLTDIIQTDAAINPGNSGGPLLNSAGYVIGINVAVARGAENIGFALPINSVKRVVEDVKRTGKISTPYIGVRYTILDKRAQDDNNLPFDYGAIVLRGMKPTEFAVIPGSPADKAGLVENDIILEVDGTKIDTSHPLGTIVSKYHPGDTILLKVWHKGDMKDVEVTLEERK